MQDILITNTTQGNSTAQDRALTYTYHFQNQEFSQIDLKYNYQWYKVKLTLRFVADMAPVWDWDADWAPSLSRVRGDRWGQRDFRGLVSRSPPTLLTLAITISNSLSLSHKRFMNESWINHRYQRETSEEQRRNIHFIFKLHQRDLKIKSKKWKSRNYVGFKLNGDELWVKCLFWHCYSATLAQLWPDIGWHWTSELREY